MMRLAIERTPRRRAAIAKILGARIALWPATETIAQLQMDIPATSIVGSSIGAERAASTIARASATGAR